LSLFFCRPLSNWTILALGAAGGGESAASAGMAANSVVTSAVLAGIAANASFWGVDLEIAEPHITAVAWLWHLLVFQDDAASGLVGARKRERILVPLSIRVHGFGVRYIVRCQ
jgi:hypothetical protein